MRDLLGVKGPASSQITIVAGIEAETEGKPGDWNTSHSEVNSTRGKFNQGAIQMARSAITGERPLNALGSERTPTGYFARTQTLEKSNLSIGGAPRYPFCFEHISFVASVNII
jgi:hypothetical protein